MTYKRMGIICYGNVNSNDECTILIFKTVYKFAIPHRILYYIVMCCKMVKGMPDSDINLHMLRMLLVFMIALNLFDIPLFQGQQNTVIYLTNNSITWIYTDSINMSRNINRLAILMNPTNGEVQYFLNFNSSIKTPVNISIRSSIDIIGSERIYYQFDNILFFSNRTYGINRINESIEGNINIDLKEIAIQWHKHEIKIPSEAVSNTTYAILSLREELSKLTLSLGKNYIRKIEGFYVVEQLKNTYRESFYFYDIYINKTQYLNTLFNADNSLCKVINELPMKASIDLVINLSMAESYAKLNIQGIEIEDPVKAYQAGLCILPLILDIQDILRNINSNDVHSKEFVGITTSIFTAINRNFIINALNAYADATNFIVRNHYNNLINSQIVFNYENKRGLLLSISNINIYYYNVTQIRKILVDLTQIIMEKLELPQFNVSEIVDESRVEIQSIHTTSTYINNRIDIWNVLIIIIIAVAVQTCIIVYIMIKIVLAKHFK